MLSKRYACPFFIIDEFINQRQLHNFINEIATIIFEEQKEQFRWEFFLHKVYDKTYSEYLDICNAQDVEGPTNAEIINTVEESKNICNGFVFE